MILNEKQRLAVSSTDRYLFLLSGAGTGKTRVIISKVSAISSENNNNSKILILSFTKRSVIDLKMKLKNMVDNLIITTFHGLCYQLISDDFRIDIFDDRFRSSLELSDQELLEIYTKKRLLDSSDVSTKPFICYSNFLSKNGLIDYTDLEILALEKLKNSVKKIDEKYVFDYIFIDEFQDTSIVQFELLKQLCSRNTRIFAVGDPDQSIYRFRGTSSKVINSYIKYFKATQLLLDTNYRCTRKILFHANSLIKHNKDKFRKVLVGVKQQDGSVFAYKVESLDHEISLVTSNIRRLLKSGYQQHEIAILFRNHKDATWIKKTLFDHYMTGITLLTMHQAKGLEFKVVFIIGVKDYIYDSRATLEEERRLFFVAMTRAMDHLYIYAYSSYGRTPRFIKESKINYGTHD